MSKGTILYIGGFELPDKNAAAHRVLSNGKIFRELGYKVVFIDVDRSLNFNTEILDTHKNVQGFDCWSIPYPQKTNEWLRYLTKIDFMCFMTSKYRDIKFVVAYNYPSLALRNLKKYCTKKNIRIIADCTEWYSTKGTNIIFKIIKGLDSFFRMRILQKHLFGLIVISEYLEKYYSNCKNVVRIPPLVDIEEKKWASKEKVNDSAKTVITYSGSPGKNKDDIPFLIEIMYKFQDSFDFNINIIGITTQQYIKDYPEHSSLINVMNKNNKINFLGRLDHLESLDILKTSDFSVFIRRESRLTNAGFPTKFVEGISCGIPIITTKTSDLESYLIEGRNGFFIDMDDIDSTIKIIKKILSMSSLEINYMKNNIYHDKFHYKNYVSEMKKILGG